MKVRFLVLLLFCLLVPTIASAGGFNLYPGAKLDPTLSSEATKSSQGTMHIDVYSASASFDKVAAFYKAKYKEDKSGESPSQMKGSRSAVFILDGASGMLMSKHYLLVKESGSTTLLYDTKSVH